jgi:hypothetical protein
MVAALLGSGRFRLIYRPHPRTGATNATYAAADARLRALVAAAVERDATAGHRVDVGPTPYAAMREADLLITDVSAMALDWLPTDRPLVVTEPAEPAAVTPASRLLDVTPRIGAATAGRVVELLDEQLTHDPSGAARAELVDYYFGGTSAADATERFVAACTEVIARRDAAMAARGAGASARGDR